MFYQTEFNTRASQWMTIASPVETESSRYRWDNIQLRLRLEPYVGRTQAVLEWEIETIPPKEIQHGILRGIKQAAKKVSSIYPKQVAPIIQFKVVITDLSYPPMDGIEYKAERAAFSAFENAISQAILTPIACLNCANHWQTQDDGEKIEFEIFPATASTISDIAESQMKFQTHERFAWVHLRFEPYQGETEFLCVSEVSPDQIEEPYVQAAFMGVKEAALSERAGQGIPINIKAILVNAKEHIVNSSQAAFYRVGLKAFEDALTRTEVINLPILD